MPASGTQAALASAVSTRARASPFTVVVILAISATGVISSRMPGGWTKAKSLYGSWPSMSRSAPPMYTPSSYSVMPLR